ncbi:MAG: TetR/AcrR family transcriptional regulator [Micropruina glycogenica]|jgi:AcrR family transcriptional regulator|uniref:Transcriptional regulator n=1 Tax=Micropruina glycogenica TaxID=75385 RepID=A0A2N9JKE2_9ACTN|nr:TetR/AcrR family transcriptional regulator [Micropruina glycogenica]MCB0893298.1 TetR/AcrR family transcriptional regulator [Propionibacteriaceae bacterium]SPD87927.1 Transcriptional regulator [Micropruina glycogenica]
MGVRDESRRQVTAAIRAAARRQIAEVGGGALSMRAIAREVGLVSSAVYRYFPTREALLTAMIVESYGNLASALPATEGLAGAEAWRTLGRGLRAWARSVPHEFQLIYGTPIPGYVAPPETVPAAAAVAEPFLRLAPRSAPDAFGDPVLADQFGALGTTFPDADGAGLAAVLAELAALIGFISLELSGHFVGTADPADALYEALLSRQVATLGLA